MAFTKESIFSKIGELLVELNDGYTALSESSEEESPAAILLLEAKAKFLAAHVEVFRQVSGATVEVAKPSASNSTFADQPVSPVEEVFFTPPIAFEEPADKQPVEDEIVEVETTSVVKNDEPAPVAAVVAPAEETTTEVVDRTEEPVAENLFTASSAQNSVEEKPQPVAAAEEKEEKVVVTTDRPEQLVEEEVVVNEVVQEPKEIVIEDKPAAVEEPKPTRPLTLNEMLQQQRRAGFAQSPAATTQPVKSQEKVVDLKSIINLNDKLLFIKDLFNGYSLAYSEAIELLNRYSTFAEADVFLQTNYALKNNWSDKPQTVEKLYAVLRKKFM
ncbi:hypothetical protein [Sphingobacterium bambusae]|uniref:DUF4476 domain-containing protein n=1 Tax=Sphingobacterium bambusae TaxID=662858 RepID=A0ABW6BM34_9SPHI|nr:hypothetical protein [Sphingobacterium bambusae]WPL49984.1 hypothetical protein SCB77_05890 [Sphingobacterium bambusae]